MRVLIADDSIVSRRLLQATLEKWEYEVTQAADGDEAWSLLQQPNGPQLAILDWMMPGMTGVELCHRIREGIKEPYVYIILLTSKNQTEDIVEGMNAGADDYLAKPFNLQELQVRLRAGRRIVELQTELMGAREALRDQATHDSLTGIKNRGTIIEALQTEVIRAERTHTPLGVVLIDLDHFKSVNDNFGHAAGDAVLRELADRMRRSVRPYDSLGRYGGEEFLLVLPSADASAAQLQAERLRLLILSQPVRYQETRLPVTASFGVTEFAPGATAELLVGTADVALYKAKRLGRNRVEYLPFMTTQLEDAPHASPSRQEA
jgi:diguanylate cyclase (GGDEF)-like protein